MITDSRALYLTAICAVKWSRLQAKIQSRPSFGSLSQAMMRGLKLRSGLTHTCRHRSHVRAVTEAILDGITTHEIFMRDHAGMPR